MPHLRPPASSDDPLATVAAMLRAGDGLRLLLAQLPPGATLDDARTLRERLLQAGRQPSALLDRALGIRR